ncbi:uncharacterized protein SPSK_06814 [Sporothrix schenckii 1099-18]|uniref:Uncharacterized protein n=1 Tax=Sporothrix schenckii 1099-18 TaxID=1397361 RepID=A0A0F2MM93_SPOSC|nr:uncharacterized protein SPSK_06814 [Sporothrix schenckii 1099-18]KJR89306.1 hypothetical protein SPSK_06814 [Sporothrix schenckii 1099-18]
MLGDVQMRYDARTVRHAGHLVSPCKDLPDPGVRRDEQDRRVILHAANGGAMRSLCKAEINKRNNEHRSDDAEK